MKNGWSGRADTINVSSTWPYWSYCALPVPFPGMTIPGTWSPVHQPGHSLVDQCLIQRNL